MTLPWQPCACNDCVAVKCNQLHLRVAQSIAYVGLSLARQLLLLCLTESGIDDAGMLDELPATVLAMALANLPEPAARMAVLFAMQDSLLQVCIAQTGPMTT